MQRPTKPFVVPNRRRTDEENPRGRQPLRPSRTAGTQNVGPTAKGKTTFRVPVVLDASCAEEV